MLASGLVTGLGSIRLAGAAIDYSPSGDDPLGVRDDFPITQNMNYLNTASQGAVPLQVLEAAIAFDRGKVYRPMPLPEMMEGVERARTNFAALIGATADEIGFVYSTSDGENIISRALDLRPGDNVVIDELHYTTSYVLYRYLEKNNGIELRIVPTTPEGAALLQDFDHLTDARTRLISVSLVSHDNGYRHDTRALAEIAHANSAYLYVDAVQAIGMFPVDVAADGIDFLTSNGYKWMHAGFNAAGMYVRRDLLDRIQPDRLGYLHVEKLPGFHYEYPTSARKFEYASPAFNGVYQMDRAIDYLNRVGLERIEAHVVPLAGYLNQELRALGFRVLTPPGTRTGIVTFNHDLDPEKLQEALDQESIVVTNRQKERDVRVSVSLHTNRAELDHFLGVMRGLA